MTKEALPTPSGPPPIAIVVSRYNATITDRLLAGAARAYQRAGGKARDLYVVEAPGSFELVALGFAAAETRQFGGVLAIGCIVKGETMHDEFLGHAVTQGLVNISLVTGVPVGLAVLTVNTVRQAQERAGGRKGDKGAEAMEALLLTAAEVATMQDPESMRRQWASAANVAKLMYSTRPGGRLSERPDKTRAGKAGPAGRGAGSAAGRAV